MSSSEKSMVRAYSEKPFKFSHKLLLGDFVSFVKQDFEERGIVLQDREK